MLKDTAKAVGGEASGVLKDVFQEGWLYIGILILGLGFGVYVLAPNPDLLRVYVKEFLGLVWPIFLAWILFGIWLSTWVHWRQEIFTKVSTRHKMLEIHIPREIMKSPRVMEQVLASIHGMRNIAGNFREHYIEGEVTRWITLEMVSFGGEVHFYVRFPWRYIDIIKNAFVASYPDLEFEEVEDYARTKIPQSVEELYKKDYDMWGAEMRLRKVGAYPIRRFKDFEQPAEEREYDTMSAFLELLGNVKKGEFLGIQFQIAALDATWRDKYKPLIEKLRRPKVAPDTYIDPATGEEISYKPVSLRTPGETDTLQAIEDNLLKPAFHTLIRFVYFSPKQLFHDTFPRRGIIGTFNQFNTVSWNGFVQNFKVATRVQFWFFPYLFPGLRAELRKQRILYNYRHREMPPETFMGKLIISSPFDFGWKSKIFEMNTECLATLFHPPSHFVLTTPHTKRIESRKMAPQAALPIYGSDEDIEKFQ